MKGKYNHLTKTNMNNHFHTRTQTSNTQYKKQTSKLSKILTHTIVEEIDYINIDNLT